MEQDSGQQRSHAPTPRRLEQAREEGRVARSRDLTGALLLTAASGALFAFGPAAAGWLVGLLRRGLSFGRAAAFDTGAGLSLAADLSLHAAMLLLPALAALAAVALLAPLVPGGWLFSAKPLLPDFERLSPGRWLAQTLSAQGAIEVGKSLCKAALIGAAALGAIWLLRDDISLLLAASGPDAIARGSRLAGTGLLAAAGAMLLLAAIDVPLQMWRHHSALRMTTEEVRREMKDSDGDPMLKQRIRSQQRQLARRRMMSEVPNASVVVTNPAHYAVALAWDESAMRAPRVVAKGTELVAARIREIAAAHGVPILEAPPLARALHRHTEVGEDVPAALYTAVAKVLAWTYALRAGRAAAEPGAIEVPPGLDPMEPAS